MYPKFKVCVFLVAPSLTYKLPPVTDNDTIPSADIPTPAEPEETSSQDVCLYIKFLLFKPFQKVQLNPLYFFDHTRCVVRPRLSELHEAALKITTQFHSAARSGAGVIRKIYGTSQISDLSCSVLRVYYLREFRRGCRKRFF
jgi:hypothetical protein